MEIVSRRLFLEPLRPSPSRRSHPNALLAPLNRYRFKIQRWINPFLKIGAWTLFTCIFYNLYLHIYICIYK